MIICLFLIEMLMLPGVTLHKDGAVTVHVTLLYCMDQMTQGTSRKMMSKTSVCRKMERHFQIHTNTFL
jgi:hypothetical protein